MSKNDYIDNLFEENRNLKNSRSSATFWLIGIIVAIWTIITTLITPLLNPTNGVSEHSCGIIKKCIICTANCSEINSNDRVAAFLIFNNTFDILLFFGISVTILILILYRWIIHVSLMDERENNSEIAALTRSNAIQDKWTQKDYNRAVSVDRLTFIILAILWFIGLIGLNKIIPGEGYPTFPFPLISPWDCFLGIGFLFGILWFAGVIVFGLILLILFIKTK